MCIQFQQLAKAMHAVIALNSIQQLCLASEDAQDLEDAQDAGVAVWVEDEVAGWELLGSQSFSQKSVDEDGVLTGEFVVSCVSAYEAVQCLLLLCFAACECSQHSFRRFVHF